MNKRERVKAAIAQRPVDHVPACFSLHFPKEASHGEAAVKAHLDFYRQTDCDVLKIMNENLVPLMGETCGFGDWAKVPAYHRRSPFMARQLDMIRRILDSAGDNVYSLATIHGICASAIHPWEETYGYVPVREMMVNTFRQDRQAVLSAFDRIADAMCDLAAACIQAGCDGIYYAALGGEKRFYTDQEFAQCIAPYDLRIMNAAKEAGGDVFLHVCKDDLNMERYRGYAPSCDVVNWGVYEAPLSMEEGRRLFPGKTIMGGLANHSGPLERGTEEELRAAVRQVIAQLGETGLILGADCTLPTGIPYERIMAAVHAAICE